MGGQLHISLVRLSQKGTKEYKNNNEYRQISTIFSANLNDFKQTMFKPENILYAEIMYFSWTALERNYNLSIIEVWFEINPFDQSRFFQQISTILSKRC